MPVPPPPPPPSLPDPQTAGTVIVGISGGVDSAVAAWLLRRAGFAVQGLFMSNWEEDDDYCTVAEDFQDARRVCEHLDIPLHRASFAEEYRQRVFGYFLREYEAGRTPNPDVLCNREIKFGVCLDYMHRLGATWIATGHYARVLHRADGSALLKAADASKDQSYFLHAVAREALARTLFPIGHLAKPQVRQLAHAAGLPVFDKPDSTGICFIGERPFAEFLARYVRSTPGPIETPEGRVVGEHRGLPFYTLGQRAGLQVGGRAGAAHAPWYVADKDPRGNRLIVVQEQDHPLLLSDAFDVGALHLLEAPASEGPFACAVKTRYRQRDLPCHVTPLPHGRVRIDLQAAARAVTPGQFAVLYAGEQCLGGGVIEARYRRAPAPQKAALEYTRGISAEGI